MTDDPDSEKDTKDPKRHKSGEQLAIEAAERAERITDLFETIAVQIATLSELAHELVERGFDEEARLTRKIVLELGRRADVVDRVAQALPLLQMLTQRLKEIQPSMRSTHNKWELKPVIVSLEHMRKMLAARCDVTLVDTQVDMKLPKDNDEG